MDFSAPRGFVLYYERGEPSLYQLDEDEKMGPLSPIGKLPDIDWAVLRLAVPRNTFTTEPVLTWEGRVNMIKSHIHKILQKGTFLQRMQSKSYISIAVWKVKDSLYGCSFCFSLGKYKSNHKNPQDHLVLESINSDCDAFRTLLAKPMSEFSPFWPTIVILKVKQLD